jgi:tRNA(adenine34) deaminase
MKDNKWFMQRAVELALLAEKEGNLPIGAVIVFNGEVVAEGRNAIWAPKFDATRHAEMEALRAMPADLWEAPDALRLYTTLEPCLMCFSSIMLHRIGSVIFGSGDHYGGASPAFTHLPPFFREQLEKIEWLGPLMPEVCDPLHARAQALEENRRA